LLLIAATDDPDWVAITINGAAATAAAMPTMNTRLMRNPLE
jgi:hypothetical protein